MLIICPMKKWGSSFIMEDSGTVIREMKKRRHLEIEDVIIKKWNYLAIDVSKIDCDYYKFLDGDAVAVNSYMGEYMANYSWAEMTTANLSEYKMAQKRKSGILF